MLKELVWCKTFTRRNTEALAEEIMEFRWQLLKQYHPCLKEKSLDKLNE
jgi:hypothetical protein